MKAKALNTACGLAAVMVSSAAWGQSASSAEKPAEGTTQVSAPASGEPGPETKEPGVSARFGFFGSHAFSADFKDTGGDLSITRGGAFFGVSVPLAERRSLDIGVQGERSRYDFGDAGGFPGSGGDGPWENVNEINAGLSYNVRPLEHWGYFVGTGVNASWEQGAEFDDSLNVQFVGGATYSASKDFTIGAGLATGSRLEDDWYFLPFPIINWNINEQWSVGTRPAAGARGFEVALEYQVTQSLQVRAFGGYEGREFRLDDNGPIPSGVGEDSGALAGLGVTWVIDPQVILSGRVGASVYREITADDQNGNELAQDELDPSLYIGAGLTFKF